MNKSTYYYKKKSRLNFILIIVVLFISNFFLIDNAQATSTEMTSTETASTETASTETASTETASTETASTETTSTEMTSTETASTEMTSTEMTSTEIASSDKKNNKNNFLNEVIGEECIEVNTFEEFELAVSNKIPKIRILQPLVFTKDITITSDVTMDFNGLNHDFKNKHIYLSDTATDINFQNFKAKGDHPGGLIPSLDGNALIIGYSSGFWGKYYFKGKLTFTGSFDIFGGTGIGAIYLPQATVIMNGVAGNIDIQPSREGVGSDPGKAYFCRAFRLELINNSTLSGPNLGKFYGRLTAGEENAAPSEGSGFFMSGGSTVAITYNIDDSVSDEGETIDVLPDNVTFSLKDDNTKFVVDTKTNINKDDNRGIVQMRGENSKVIVSELAKLEINSESTSCIRLQGSGSSLHVLSGGKLYAQLNSDNDVTGNNGLRFAGSGMSFFIDGIESEVNVVKNNGSSAAVLFENSNQNFSVTNGGTLKVHNVGDGKEYSNRIEQGNQAILFAKTSFWASGGSANFTVDGENSNIDLRADSGSVIDTTGSIDMNFTANEKTFLVLIGKTGKNNTGIISGDQLYFRIENPRYFDLQNKRVGTENEPGGLVFQGSKGNSLVEISKSEISLWRKSEALTGNFDKDPDVYSSETNLSFFGANLETVLNTAEITPELAEEFATHSGGMKNYNRISGNNQLPIVDSLRVPTNADKKIYGHVSVPEGVKSNLRDAWTDEVEVTLRITYANPMLSPVEITANTKGEDSENDGYNPWNEGAQGGLFEIKVPYSIWNNGFLATGDKIEVIEAKKINNGQKIVKLDSAKTTVKIVPPQPAKLDQNSIHLASKEISGTGAPGSTVILKKNGLTLGSTSTVDSKGNFKINIPEGSLKVGDRIEVFLNDNSGDATLKGVINKPITNNSLGNTQPSTLWVKFHDAPAFWPAPKLYAEGGLFMSVPKTIKFKDLKANGLVQESIGNVEEPLMIYDQRNEKNTWTLSVKQTKEFTDPSTKSTLNNVLYFAKEDNRYQLLSLNENIEVVTGKNKNNEGVSYSYIFKNNKGFKIILPKEKQKVGEYSSELTWSLADVPSGG